MLRVGEYRPRPRIGRALGTIAAALLCVTVLSQPNLAYAGHGGGGGGRGGGGGFHGGGGGGFHGGGFGGFHGGGFGGFHSGFAGMHTGFGERHEGFGDRRADFGERRFDRDRFHDNRFFFGGWGGWPYGWDYSPDYSYSYYGYSQPYSSQTWYYCWDPAGYYPYVTQCNTGWQAVPAG
jgi:hypothetical protein